MHFFPIPYKNELLYSILARYCIRSGNVKSIHNFEDIFGKRSCVAVFEFASNLDRLIKNLPYGSELTAKYLIYNHTIFPFYAHFMSKDEEEKVIEEMRGDRGDKVYTRLGLVSNSLKLNEYMMFCPECIKENIKIYGESYWDRLHQIPGVFVCYKHKTLLHKSKILTRGGNRQVYVPQNYENCILEEGYTISDDLFKKMLWIIEDVETLIESKIIFRDRRFFKNKFRTKLIENGYARLNNFILQKKLKNDFIDFYGQEYLSLLQSSVSHNDRCWLTLIFYDDNFKTNPIRYLLLSRFLGMSAKELIEENEDGDKDEEYYKSLWYAKIKDLVSDGKSIREISKEINSSTKTIKKVLEELKISPSYKWNGGGKYVKKKYKETEEFIEKREEKRSKWIEILESNPDKSNSKLREIDSSTYRWLSKYDIEWLRNNSSKVKMTNYTVNWEERDKELLSKVEKVIEDMKKGKPERITWTSIGKRLGICGWLLKRKDKLPLTKKFIESKLETLDEFHIRKIKWAIEELNKQGKEITFWNIVEVSGVKEKYLRNILNKNME